MTRHRILLAEDNPDSSAALDLFLRSHGFEVVVAFNGQEALDRLRAGPRPCLILLDVMMRGTDGHAFRAAQLADPALAAIPVIVFSGAYDVGGIAARLGVRDYLTKPLDAQRLLDAVRRPCAHAPGPGRRTTLDQPGPRTDNAPEACPVGPPAYSPDRR